ncbi:MAG: TonB-dependent receptor, partial [Rhizomicrobium sp.]
HEDSVGDQTVYAADKDTGALYSSDYLYTVHDPASYNEAAMFGSLTYHFTKDFDLQLGGRLSAQHQKFTDELGGLLEGGTDITKTASSANVFTYSITPRYHISEDMMVYARVATGYRPGGGNSAPDEPSSYGPDRTVNYEIGFKGVLLPHLLTVDTSLFDIEWNNIQLEATSPTNFSFVENGGAARSRGAEISAYLTPLDGMTIAANFSYVDAVLTRNVNVSSLYGIKGDRLPYSSKTAGSISVDQDFPLAIDLDGFVGATFNYTGSRYAAFPTKSAYSRFFMPAYGTVDLRAGVEYQDWKISLYAKNVFDQVGFTYGQSRNVATRSGNYDASIIAPRTVGLSVTRNF